MYKDKNDCPRCETPGNHSLSHNHPLTEVTWREDNMKLLQKMLRDKVNRPLTGDAFLDSGRCPLCGNPVTIEQEAYSTIYECHKNGCAIKRITVEV